MAGSALREVFARFGVDFENQALDAGAQSVDGMAGKLRELGGILAGGALVLGLRSFVMDIAAVGDEIDKTSLALGLSTDALQQWRAAAGHLGVGAAQMTPAIQALRRNAGAAAEGSTAMARDFRALGVTLRDESGQLLGTEALLEAVADGMAGMTDPTERAALSMRLMGEQGGRLLPLLSGGAAGIHEAADAFEALGGGMSEEAIAASAEYTDRMQDVDDALTGIKSRIAVFVLPAITRLAEAMSRAEAGLSRLIDRGALLQAAFVVLGTAAVAAGASTAAAWVAAAAPFVLLGTLVLGLILLVEDLIIGFEGGRSAIGDLGTEIERMVADSAEDLGGLVYLWEYLAGVIDAATRAVLFFGTQVGLIDPESTIGRFATEGVADQIAQRASDPAQAARAQAAYEASSIGQGGAASFFVPDRLAAAYFTDQAARVPTPRAAEGGAGRGATVFSPAVTIQVDADGLTAAQAEPVIRRAVDRALSAQADDLADTLAGSGA